VGFPRLACLQGPNIIPALANSFASSGSTTLLLTKFSSYLFCERNVDGHAIKLGVFCLSALGNKNQSAGGFASWALPRKYERKILLVMYHLTN
jgi:hypothetical protein